MTQLPHMTVLPSLKTITWFPNNLNELLLIQNLLSPSLSSINIHYHPIAPSHSIPNPKAFTSLCSLISSFQSMPGLVNLSLQGLLGLFAQDEIGAVAGSRAAALRKSLSGVLHKGSSLREVALEDYGSAFIPVDNLGQLRRLSSLVLSLPNFKHSDPESTERNDSDLFENLVHLHITSCDVASAAKFLSKVTSPALESIELFLNIAQSEGPPQFFVYAGRWSRLKILKIQPKDEFEETHLIIRMADISSLLQCCPHMEAFEIASYVWDMTDADMKAIATAWPDLERLGFCQYPIALDLATHSPRVTLFGVHDLVISCLYLQSLCICLNADMIPETDNVRTRRRRTGFKFSPGISLLRSAESVGEYMAAMGQKGYKFTMPKERVMLNTDIRWRGETRRECVIRAASWCLAKDIAEGMVWKG